VRQDGFSKALPGDDIRLAWSDRDEHQFDQTAGHRLAPASSDMKQFAVG
jgi:hypothetical protein